MFYVANVITFSVFVELLWKFTSLVRYKLNRFRPPRVNQFYICALKFGGYARLIPLFLYVSIENGNLPSGSSSIHYFWLRITSFESHLGKKETHMFS